MEQEHSEETLLLQQSVGHFQSGAVFDCFMMNDLANVMIDLILFLHVIIMLPLFVLNKRRKPIGTKRGMIPNNKLRTKQLVQMSVLSHKETVWVLWWVKASVYL